MIDTSDNTIERSDLSNYVNPNKNNIKEIIELANLNASKRLDNYLKIDKIKKEKESKKKQKVISMKEVRLRPVIEKHDLETKASMANKFLSSGDKVKVSVRFRGRELGHKDMGVKIIEKFMELIQDHGTAGENNPKLEGSTMVLMIEPIKK